MKEKYIDLTVKFGHVIDEEETRYNKDVNNEEVLKKIETEWTSNQKETMKTYMTHNEKKRLGEFDTQRKH